MKEIKKINRRLNLITETIYLEGIRLHEIDKNKSTVIIINIVFSNYKRKVMQLYSKTL